MPYIEYTTPNQYVVTALVWNDKRDWVSKPMTRGEAEEFAKKLAKEMKNSSPKYRWATNIRIEKVDI